MQLSSRLRSVVRQRLASRHEDHDGGFTLIEMMATLTIMAVVIAVTTSIIITLLNDNAGMDASVQGTEQAQTASQTFVQYLQSAGDPSASPDDVCSSSPFTSAGGDSMTFTSYIGYGPTGTGSTEAPITSTVTAELTAGRSSNNNVFSIFKVIFGSSQTVESYDVNVAPTTPVFTYYSESSPGDLTPITLVSNVVPSADLASIAAVSYDLPFMAPPGHNIEGYSADATTELKDTVWLQNCQ